MEPLATSAPCNSFLLPRTSPASWQPDSAPAASEGDAAAAAAAVQPARAARAAAAVLSMLPRGRACSVAASLLSPGSFSSSDEDPPSASAQQHGG